MVGETETKFTGEGREVFNERDRVLESERPELKSQITPHWL